MSLEYITLSQVETSLNSNSALNEEAVNHYISSITSKLRKALSKNYYKKDEQSFPVHIKQDIFISDDELDTVCRLYKGNGGWKSVSYVRGTVDNSTVIKFSLNR